MGVLSFLSFENKDIIEDAIADYNKEFCEGAVLITDYSSVAFDFAYLGKPVIYSQFDKETFYQGHLYNEGYFKYERDGFGPVITELDAVVDELVDLIKNDCKNKEEYIKRREAFYFFNDKNSCERIHKAIKEL
mgnify:CR=1 FL=1